MAIPNSQPFTLSSHGPGLRAEAVRHRLSPYYVLVGPAADGRKGASWCRSRRLFEAVDPAWVIACLRHGLTVCQAESRRRGRHAEGWLAVTEGDTA